MEVLLGRVTAQAMNYAIRSGITITSGYAIQQATKLLKNVPPDSSRDELYILQKRLESKIRIIAPAIDMIELIAARGNTSLESAVQLTKELRRDIQALGQRLNKAAEAEESLRRRKSKAREVHELELKLVIKDIRALLAKIEEAVPMINLAITTSGAKLSTTLPATVSPSRLLQASTLLTSSDGVYAMGGCKKTQIGLGFSLSLYMLFQGHADRLKGDEENVNSLSWKEVIHKARVKLQRVPLDHKVHGEDTSVGADDQLQQPFQAEDQTRASSHADEYAYQITIIEDLDDGRFHTPEDGDTEDQYKEYEDVAMAGIREIVPIHQIAKIFYADTGKILNMGGDDENQAPVLLLKRDTRALPPRKDFSQELNDEPWNGNEEASEDYDAKKLENGSAVDGGLRTAAGSKAQTRTKESRFRFLPSLDPDWLAFEVFEDDEDDEDDSETYETPSTNAHSLTSDMNSLHLSPQNPSSQIATHHPHHTAIKSSLSLFEMLIRLTSLQQFQQRSHLAISDELLNFFLEESSTTGAGSDADERKRRRSEAQKRLGFDPYAESPLQRRRMREEAYGYEEGEWDDEDVEQERGGGRGQRRGPAVQTPESGGRRRQSGMGYPSPQSSPPTVGRSAQRKSAASGWREKMAKEYPNSPLRTSQSNGADHDSGIGTSSPDPPQP